MRSSRATRPWRRCGRRLVRADGPVHGALALSRLAAQPRRPAREPRPLSTRVSAAGGPRTVPVGAPRPASIDGGRSAPRSRARPPAASRHPARTRSEAKSSSGSCPAGSAAARRTAPGRPSTASPRSRVVTPHRPAPGRAERQWHAAAMRVSSRCSRDHGSSARNARGDAGHAGSGAPRCCAAGRPSAGRPASAGPPLPASPFGGRGQLGLEALPRPSRSRSWLSR